MGIKVFFCEPIGIERRWLRRFSRYEERVINPCPLMHGDHSYHNAMVQIEDAPEEKNDEGYLNSIDVDEYKGDPRWPTTCPCGYEFKTTDDGQVFRHSLYKRLDQPSSLPLPIEDMPPGAMWNAWWMPKDWQGPDGMSLMVRCPDGHDWMVDSRASNCTMPKDDVHKCWVRHGDPRTGNVHVDKNGFTCAAGAGSIQTPKWHGFLHNGELVQC